MRVAIAYSLQDKAGTGAASHLKGILAPRESTCPRAVECLEGEGFKLAGFREDVLYFDWLDETPDPEADAVIVLSRHRAESGKPSLTVHHTGNPTRDNSHGGDPSTLAYSAPALSKLLLTLYRSVAEETGLMGEYEVTLEATHHGPTRPRKPIVFIEIGSGPEQWVDERVHRALAETVARALDTIHGGLPECTPAAGFGGTHYPIKFTRLHLDGEYCMGHIIPKYAFAAGVSDDVIVQAVEKTWPEPVSTALVEKKSLKSADRRRVVALLESIGVNVVRV
ncbi:MAG: D-aminoacyl-tRNA deacylase [Desulfurococcales archaeon]|nr:D-aminoacyl-tRNA deacylase [Desulfurococcales archaeon]